MFMFDEIHLNEEPRQQLLKDMPQIDQYTEMSGQQSAFLCGLLQWKKPRKILEVGIASGGTSAIVMKCLEKLDYPYTLYSVDKSETCYRGRTEMPSGFLGEEVKSHLSFVGETIVFRGSVAGFFG